MTKLSFYVIQNKSLRFLREGTIFITMRVLICHYVKNIEKYRNVRRKISRYFQHFFPTSLFSVSRMKFWRPSMTFQSIIALYSLKAFLNVELQMCMKFKKKRLSKFNSWNL